MAASLLFTSLLNNAFLFPFRLLSFFPRAEIFAGPAFNYSAPGNITEPFRVRKQLLEKLSSIHSAQWR